MDRRMMATQRTSTSKNDVQNGSSHEKAQATFQPPGYCPRCAPVRLCIKCQQGTHQPSGYSLPQPYQQPKTCQCSACSQNNAFHRSVCIPIKCLPDQSAQSGVQFEQQEVQTTLSEDVSPSISPDAGQKESRNAAAEGSFSRPPLQGMSMQERITEEPTMDENTEKTSFLPSQRDSAPSTWQEASKLGRQQEVEDAFEAEPPEQEDTPYENGPSQEGSVKELLSTAMQADFSHEEQCEPLPIVVDKPEDEPEAIENQEEECDDNKIHPEPTLNEFSTLCEPPPSGLEPPSILNLNRLRSDHASCKRVMDCLKQCSEKLQEMRQLPDTNAPRTALSGYWPQQGQHSVESPMTSEMKSAPEVISSAPTAPAPEEDTCSCIKECVSQAAMTPRSPSQPAIVSQSPLEQANPPLGEVIEPTNPVESSASKSSWEKSESVASKQQPSAFSGLPQSDTSAKKSTLSKDQTSKIDSASKQQPSAFSGVPQSDSSANKSTLSKDQTSKTESASKQQTSGFSGLTQSDSFGKKSIESKCKSVFQQSAFGISGIPSDSTLIKCTLTKENLSLCKQLCEKLNQMPSPEISTSRSVRSKQSDTDKSKAAGASKQKLPSHQEQELTQLKRMISRQDSSSKKSASQQESNSKRSASQQESLSRRTASQQESFSKRTARQESSSKRTASHQESTLKKTASQQEPAPKKSTSPKKLASAHRTEFGERSLSRKQQWEKSSELLSKSVYSKELSRQPSLQSPKQSTTDSVKRKHSTQATRRISEASQMQSEASQKLVQPSPQKPEMSQKSVAPVSRPEGRKSSAKTPRSSLPVADTPHSEKIATPDKGKVPPKTQAKDTDSQKKALNQQMDKGTEPITSDNKEQYPKNIDKKNSMQTEQITEKNRSDNGSESFRSDGDRNSPSAASEKPDDETLVPYCLQAYYLPLYQCAYCQQITPYPVSCQTGLVCCPSPYDPFQGQPCYPSSPPSFLPSDCQTCFIPCPQPYSPEKNHPDQSLPINQFQPVKPCPQTQSIQPLCPQSCADECCSCSPTATCSTSSESCQAPCEQCNIPRETSKIGGDGGGSKDNRHSIESDQSALHSSDVKTQTSEDDQIGDPEKTKNKAGETIQRRKDSDKDTAKRKKEDKARNLNEGSGIEYDGDRESGKGQERDQNSRRGELNMKDNYEKDTSVKNLDKKGKLRRINTDDKSGEQMPKGSITKTHRSPRLSTTAQSAHRYSEISKASKSGGIKKLQDLDGESHTGRQINMKSTQAIERENRPKAGRSFGQSLFERAIFKIEPQRSMERAGKYQSNSSLQGPVAKSTLRKQLTRPTLDLTCVDRIVPELSEKQISDAKGGAPRWSSSVFPDHHQRHNARCSLPRCSIAGSNDETHQKHDANTKLSQMKAETNSYSNTDTSSLLSTSRRCGYPSSEKRKNVYSPYYLPPAGAPHRITCSTRRQNVNDRLHHNMAQSSKPESLTKQEINSHLPSVSSSASSIDGHSASYLSEDQTCDSLLESSCPCTDYKTGKSVPESNPCASARQYGCPLHLNAHPKGSSRTPCRSRHPKAKPLSLRSRRTLRTFIRGKRHLAEQKPR